MKSILTFAFITMISSFSAAAEFCVAHWDSSFQFKEEFGVFLTSTCEGSNLSSDKLFMRLSSSRTQRLEQQITSQMKEIGYAPVARLENLVFFEKGAQGPKDTCTIEFSKKYRPTLACSNKSINTRIYLDDLEMYKVYLARMGYNFVTEFAPQVGSAQVQYLVFQK